MVKRSKYLYLSWNELILMKKTLEAHKTHKLKDNLSSHAFENKSICKISIFWLMEVVYTCTSSDVGLSDLEELQQCIINCIFWISLKESRYIVRKISISGLMSFVKTSLMTAWEYVSITPMVLKHSRLFQITRYLSYKYQQTLQIFC